MRNSGKYPFKINSPFADAEMMEETLDPSLEWELDDVDNQHLEWPEENYDEEYEDDTVDEDIRDDENEEDDLDESSHQDEYEETDWGPDVDGEVWDDEYETFSQGEDDQELEMYEFDGGEEEEYFENEAEACDCQKKEWNEEFEDQPDYFAPDSIEENYNTEGLTTNSDQNGLMTTYSLEEQFLSNLKGLFNSWSQAPKNIVANIGYSGTITDLRHLAKNVKKGVYNGRPYYTISRVKNRNLADVKGIVLHQMAFNRDDDFTNYLKTGAHYIILRDGKIGQLYDHNINLNASNGFNSSTLAVEFAGNFPNAQGKWWHPSGTSLAKKKKREHKPTKEQIRAGRFLLRKLINDNSMPNFKHVFAHRQSSRTRSNDPGPDIWCSVAEWAIKYLGYTDANGVTKGSGKSIPADWRSCFQDNQTPLKKDVSQVGQHSLIDLGRNILIGLGDLNNIPKIPPQFKAKKRNGTLKGLSRYADQRLDQSLIEIRRKYNLTLSNQEIDLFQRIANVETGGKINGINTWDSGVVSLGFMQLTLKHGKIQRWIKNSSKEFKRYGIELDADFYTFGRYKVSAIKGVTNPSVLRWGSWAMRFYSAGLDERIIIAEIEEARYYLKTHLARIKKLVGQDYDIFFQEYRKSAHVRGMFHAAYNNLPVAAKSGTQAALMAFRSTGDTGDFKSLLAEKIKLAYKQRNDPEGAGRLVRVTSKGSELT